MDTSLIFNNISRHISLSEEEKDFFIGILRPKHIKKKDFLLQAGEISRYENFITKGCLRMYYIDNDGAEHIVMFAIQDWWISDLYSFLSQKPSIYYVDAIEDTELLQISKTDLETLYEQVPKFERFFRIMFQNAFVAQQSRITQNLSLSAEERYLQYLDKYPQLEQRIPQKQIAAYLGITPEFLSMLRSKMVRR